MRVKLQRAYCIHSRCYRESSQILEVLTPDYGLVSCLNRGSRKQNSAMEFLFTPLLLSWSGRGDLFTLIHLESVKGKKITLPGLCIIGMYLNELILRLVPKSSPSEEIFNLYQNIISVLDESEKQEKLLRLFEIELLTLLGHGLSLDKEIDHETPVRGDYTYRYEVGVGPARVTQASTAWNVVGGATLLSLQTPLNMDSACLTQAKYLMRGIIDWHLGNRVLRSREILQFMRA